MFKNFPIYSCMIILSIILNIIIVFLLNYKYKYFNFKELICLLLYENTGIIIGAKILTYILNYNKNEVCVKFAHTTGYETLTDKNTCRFLNKLL